MEPDPAPSTVPVTPAPPPYIPAPPPYVPAPPPYIPAPQNPPPYIPPTTPPPPRRTPLIVGAVLAVIMLATIGVGGYLLATSDSDDSANDARDGRSTEATSTADPTKSSSAPSTPVTPSATPSATQEAVPLVPVDLSDETGDALLGGQGPETSSAGDLKQVRIHPQQDGQPGWVIVTFADDASPPVGVIVRFDVNGDSRADFVAWRHVTSGASGSGAVGDWGHGRDILDGSQADDPRFPADYSAAPQDGLAFPFRLQAGESPREKIRVNVQMVSDTQYYDYVPARHVWSPRVGIATRP